MFYRSPILAVSRCGISYCDKNDNNKDGHETCKELVKYYYEPINGEKKINNTKKKIRRTSYFKEKASFNYEEYTGKLHTMFQQPNKIRDTLVP